MRTLIVAAFACLISWSAPVFADSQRPSVVPNVSAEGVSGPAIIVSWREPRDNVGVDGYNIYRDGNYYRTVGRTTNYIDRNISARREYRYAIVAFDRARNYSKKSATARAQSGGSSPSGNASNPPPTSTGKPAPPRGLKATVLNRSTARISWNAPAGGAEGYNLYKDGKYHATVKGRNVYVARSLQSTRSYAFHVVAFRSNRFSSRSARISVRTAGATAGPAPVTPTPSANGKPPPPTALKATVVNSSSVRLTWRTPEGGAEGYNIYRDGSYLTTVKGRNVYIARSLSRNRNYGFHVVAFRNNKFSGKSSRVNINTNGGTTTPSPPPPGNGSGDSAVPAGYKLVFNDEFNRGSIDSSKWNTSYRWGANWIINNEKQYYIDTLRDRDFGATPFKLNGSRLTIEATRTPGRLNNKAQGQQYLSGAMTTHNKFRMRYGYVEMRARLPKGKGLWPAFWLLHESNNRRKPEIDVMEMLGDNTRLVYQTYHYYDNSTLRSTPSFRAPGPDYSAGFHTFGMLWESGRITWYVDGKLTNRYTNGKVSDESMYILMNLALGGSWAGDPDGSTRFPARFEIDYVRAYQKR